MSMDRKIEKKKWPLSRIISYSAAGLFVLVIGYLLIFNTGGATLNVQAERITIAKIENGPFQEYIPIIGNVRPLTQIFLNAVEGGRVETIYTEAGTMVNKGDKILKLSNTNLLMTLLNNEAQINRASNDLRTTRLQLEQNKLSLDRDKNEVDYALKRAKDRFERNEVLYKDGLISKQEYEDFKNEYEYSTRKKTLSYEAMETDLKFREQQVKDLELSVKRMEENLTLVREQYENLTIRAPISGQLTSLNVEPGQFKNPGDSLGQIDVIHGYKVRADVDEHYITRVEVGKVGQFDLAGKTFMMSIIKVFPEVKNGTFQVDLGFGGKEPEGIKRGQTIHIRLQLSEQAQALLLPRGGFFQTTGGNWVFVLDSSGKKAVKRNIRLGRQNPQFFEVLEGLQPGEEVITSSYEDYTNMDTLVIK